MGTMGKTILIFCNLPSLECFMILLQNIILIRFLYKFRNKDFATSVHDRPCFLFNHL